MNGQTKETLLTITIIMSCEVWFYVMFFLNVNPPLQFYLHSYVSISMVPVHISHVTSTWTPMVARAASHMRLRARHQYTSNTLIGGKDGGGSSLLHTTIYEGPTKYMKARWI